MNKAARIFDAVLGLLKWPIAILALILVPGLIYALFYVVSGAASSPSSYAPFLIGAGAYTILWFALGDRRLGPWSTFEHELTHALFAWATFHQVVGVRATLIGGGHIRYVGRGNWLIAIAPFFFPALSLLAILVLTWVPGRHVVIGGAILGVTTAHHTLATWSATHRHHSDLREAGWLFYLPVLVAANAFLLGLLISYASGARSLTAHLEHVRGPSLAFFRWLLRLVLPT